MSGGSGGDDQNKTLFELLEELMESDETYETGPNSTADELRVFNDILKELDSEMLVRKDLGLQEPNPKVDDEMVQTNKIPFLPPTPPTYTPQSPQQLSPQSVVDSVSSSNVPVELNRASDLLMAVSVGADANKTRIFQLAYSAMDELVRKVQAGEPLWQRKGKDENETLNEAEYIRDFRALDASLKDIMRMVETGYLFDFDEISSDFSGGIGSQNPNFHREPENDSLLTEASRDIGFVAVNPTTLVDWFMDCNQWSSMFANIVSGTVFIGDLSSGLQPRMNNETLQVLRAEYHMPTPHVPSRECHFARYSKQVSPKTWGVVDVSLEDVFPYPCVSFRRRPSGCLIEELPDETSKVMWVEHVEVDRRYSVHPLFRSLVRSGAAFSAKRWVATIVKHCEWVATMMSDHIPSIGGELMLRNGKESLLRLAERMMRDFFINCSASSCNPWIPLPVKNAQDSMVMSKTVYSFSGTAAATVVFTTSIWIPTPPTVVFDFLRRDNCRKKWDILAHDNEIREISTIIKGGNSDNRVSILQVVDTAAKKVVITHLQESYSNPTGSYVVYAPIDIPSMASLLSGGNPDIVKILPSGFVIHPDRTVPKGQEGTVGTVATIVFHIIDDLSGAAGFLSDPYNTMFKVLGDTAFNIKEAIMSLAIDGENVQKEI